MRRRRLHGLGSRRRRKFLEPGVVTRAATKEAIRAGRLDGQRTDEFLGVSRECIDQHECGAMRQRRVAIRLKALGEVMCCSCIVRCEAGSD